jgi:probable O-glycosylation ligase (exosortase A-associated)
MRDVALVVCVALVCCYAIIHPWIGVMGWTLLSIMNLHKLTWAAADLPLAAVLACSTLVGMLFTHDRRQAALAPATILLVMFMVWICITLPFSFSVDGSMDMFKKVMKVDFMILVALVLINSRTQIMALAAVLVFSIGFYGLKGGIFTIVNGGNYRVWGPEGTFIEGNNELALAIIVCIPLMRFLQMQLKTRATRWAMGALMVLSAIAALGTQSRGALIAIVAMAAMLWWRNRNKAVFGVLIAIIGIGIIAFMPSTWESRMMTITEYEQDGSAMGRINAWWMAWNLAKANFTGGGFVIYDPGVFQAYAPNPTDVHAAHSIYFQVLGEHGFLGLILFVAIWITVWRTAATLRRVPRVDPATSWVADLGSMSQVSLVGYLVGGMFLSLAYFDLPYNVLVLVVAASRWLKEVRSAQKASGAPVAPASANASPRAPTPAHTTS